MRPGDDHLVTHVDGDAGHADGIVAELAAVGAHGLGRSVELVDVGAAVRHGEHVIASVAQFRPPGDESGEHPVAVSAAGQMPDLGETGEGEMGSPSPQVALEPHSC